MDPTHTTDDPTRVDADELRLVALLLEAMSPSEGGPQPGAQLARAGSGRVWTITAGSTSIHVRRSGSIYGLRHPVWMTARCVAFAAASAGRHGGCRVAEFRLVADGRLHVPIEAAVRVELLPLMQIGQLLLCDEAVVTIHRNGELRLTVDDCTVVVRGGLSLLQRDELEGVVHLVGQVADTDEAVLSLDGDCPVDGVVVWLESKPEDYMLLEWFEELYDVVWYAEPEVYGVVIPDI